MIVIKRESEGKKLTESNYCAHLNLKLRKERRSGRLLLNLFVLIDRMNYIHIRSFNIKRNVIDRRSNRLINYLKLSYKRKDIKREND